MYSNRNAARTRRIDTAADRPGGRAKSTTIRHPVHSYRSASTGLIATARRRGGLRAPPAPSREDSTLTATTFATRSVFERYNI
jgi:hypothetical protein